MIFWTLVGVAVLAPLAIAAVHPWTWSLMACLVGVLLIAWSAQIMLSRSGPAVGLRRTWFILVLFAITAGWAALQALPTMPSTWHHPLWRSAASALGVDLAGAISLDPFESRSALLRLLTYAGVFWLALQYCSERKRAQQVFFVLVVAGLA